MRTLSLLSTCGLLLAVGPAPAAAQTGAKDPAAAEARQERGSGWWNDPAVAEELGLGAEQRAKMDGYFDGFRERLQAAEAQAARTAFTDALEAGDWKQARSALEKLSAESALPVRAHGELKIEVLSTLDAEQLAKLVKGYPRLISQPWVRIPRRGGPRQRTR